MADNLKLAKHQSIRFAYITNLLLIALSTNIFRLIAAVKVHSSLSVHANVNTYELQVFMSYSAALRHHRRLTRKFEKSSAGFERAHWTYKSTSFTTGTRVLA